MLKLAAYVQSHVARLRYSERGQTMAEYGVILAVITVGIIAALLILSGGIEAAIKKVDGVLRTGKSS